MMAILSLHDMLAKDPPPVEWAVDGLIAQGDRCLVYGEWGSLKSWLLLHLSLHLAAGQPWLGHPVGRPLVTLYVDEEMHQSTLIRRVRRLHEGAGFTSWSLPFYALSRQGLVMDQSGPARLMQWCKTADVLPDVVVIESFRRVLIGSENDSQQVGQFWRVLDTLSKQGITLILSHHMHKPQDGRGTRHKASGSSDIMAGCDAAIAIERVSPGVIQVEATKSREAPEAATWQAEMRGLPGEPVAWARVQPAAAVDTAFAAMAYTPSPLFSRQPLPVKDRNQ